MMVHRLLERYLHGGRSVNVQKLEDQCKHSSEMEQLAANASSSIKYKQVEYMGDHMGEVYSGVISGVTEWGLYVELDDNMCEGLVLGARARRRLLRLRREKLLPHRTPQQRALPSWRQRARAGGWASLEKRQLDFVLIDDRGRRPGEDTLGHDVTARQALARKGAHARPPSTTAHAINAPATAAELPPRPITPDRHR